MDAFTDMKQSDEVKKYYGDNKVDRYHHIEYAASIVTVFHTVTTNKKTSERAQPRGCVEGPKVARVLFVFYLYVIWNNDVIET